MNDDKQQYIVLYQELYIPYSTLYIRLHRTKPDRDITSIIRRYRHLLNRTEYFIQRSAVINQPWQSTGNLR